jgi:hypothetical protein
LQDPHSHTVTPLSLLDDWEHVSLQFYISHSRYPTAAPNDDLAHDDYAWVVALATPIASAKNQHFSHSWLIQIFLTIYFGQLNAALSLHSPGCLVCLGQHTQLFVHQTLFWLKP